VSFGSGVIGAFQTGTYVVTRTALGTTVNGQYVPGGTSTINVDASVQPVSGRALRDLPEGMRAEDVKVVYTATELFTVRATGTPDIITIAGDRYRVTKVEAFSVISDHYRVTVERLEVP
jgi:hypothetical protein